MKSLIGILFLFFLICCSPSSNKALERFYVSNGDSVRVIYDADSGYRKSLAVIKQGKENGLYKTYYKNGKTNEIGLMRNNLKEGLWMSFDRDSTLSHVAHFSNDTIVVELDKSDFEFAQRSIGDNCSLSIPSKWETEPLGNADILLGIHKRCDSVPFCPNIVLVSYSESPDLPFTSFIDKYSGLLKDNYQNLKIIYGSALKINGKDAYQMGIKLKKNNINLGAVITLIKGQDKFYILTGMASSDKPGEFFKYKGLFEQVAATFKIYE